MVAYCPAHDFLPMIVAAFCLFYTLATPKRRMSDWAVISASMLYLAAQTYWVLQQYCRIMPDEQSYLWTFIEIYMWWAIWLLIRRRQHGSV